MTAAAGEGDTWTGVGGEKGRTGYIHTLCLPKPHKDRLWQRQCTETVDSLLFHQVILSSIHSQSIAMDNMFAALKEKTQPPLPKRCIKAYVMLRTVLHNTLGDQFW